MADVHIYVGFNVEEAIWIWNIIGGWGDLSLVDSCGASQSKWSTSLLQAQWYQKDLTQKWKVQHILIFALIGSILIIRLQIRSQSPFIQNNALNHGMVLLATTKIDMVILRPDTSFRPISSFRWGFKVSVLSVYLLGCRLWINGFTALGC